MTNFEVTTNRSSLCDRPGCIFENRGRIPDSAVQPQKALSPVEDAVYKNNVPLLTSLLQVFYI